MGTACCKPALAPFEVDKKHFKPKKSQSTTSEAPGDKVREEESSKKGVCFAGKFELVKSAKSLTKRLAFLSQQCNFKLPISVASKDAKSTVAADADPQDKSRKSTKEPKGKSDVIKACCSAKTPLNQPEATSIASGKESPKSSAALGSALSATMARLKKGLKPKKSNTSKKATKEESALASIPEATPAGKTNTAPPTTGTHDLEAHAGAAKTKLPKLLPEKAVTPEIPEPQPEPDN